jgi:hypothetical protein
MTAANSELQQEFLRVLALGHRATAGRIMTRLVTAGLPRDLLERCQDIVSDELRGLYHGNLVVLDGGSSLADHGIINLVDDKGQLLVKHLHEIGFDVYDAVR